MFYRQGRPFKNRVVFSLLTGSKFSDMDSMYDLAEWLSGLELVRHPTALQAWRDPNMQELRGHFKEVADRMDRDHPEQMSGPEQFVYAKQNAAWMDQVIMVDAIPAGLKKPMPFGEVFPYGDPTVEAVPVGVNEQDFTKSIVNALKSIMGGS